MTNENMKKLIADFEGLEKLLEEYASVTAALMKIGNDEIDELNKKAAERQALIDKMEVLRKEAYELIDKSENQEAELIRSMLAGNNINQRISDSLIPLRNAIVSLRSAQSKTMEKEKSMSLQFSSRYEEVKEQLKRLNDEKKKINYYNSLNNTSALGKSLDSRS